MFKIFLLIPSQYNFCKLYCGGINKDLRLILYWRMIHHSLLNHKYDPYTRKEEAVDRQVLKSPNIIIVSMHVQYIIILNKIILSLSYDSFILSLHERVLIWHIKSG
jgi:hypothetical protein